MQFTELGLAEPILKALAAKNYATPTPIQQKAIPVLLEGRDLCGIAQTGTGKTAAFALPSLDHFARNPKQTPLNGCRMLVLSPTRELAAQIAQSFRDYGRFLKLSVEVVFGGVPINRQIKALSRGVDIVVATPGRLLDLLDQRAFTIKDTEIFVLDEADQMMDMGFIHPLRRIAKLLPKERQNLFFSATMPKEIEALAAQFLNDPVKVSVAPQSTTAERVLQRASFVNQAEKQALLTLTVKNEPIDRALIFTRTKHGADRVVRFLEGAGIQAVAIHGNKSQAQRTTALQAFRHGHVKLLVATDIAARGIDVSGVSHVINFELPNVPEQYVHRIGRTARAGREGVAVSFCAQDEREYLRDIQRLTKVTLDQVPLPQGLREEVAVVAKHAEPVRGPRRTPGRGQPPRRDTRTEAQRDARGEVRVEPRKGQGERRPATAKPHGERRHAQGKPHGEHRHGTGKPGGNRRRRNRSNGGRAALA